MIAPDVLQKGAPDWVRAAKSEQERNDMVAVPHQPFKARTSHSKPAPALTHTYVAISATRKLVLLLAKSRNH